MNEQDKASVAFAREHTKKYVTEKNAKTTQYCAVQRKRNYSIWMHAIVNA